MISLKDWHIFLSVLVVGGMLLATHLVSYDKGYDKGHDDLYYEVRDGLRLKKGQAHVAMGIYMFTYDQGFFKVNPVPRFPMNGDCKGCHGINVPRGTKGT